ncbi:MAG TPA: hypothetical protein VMZ53_12285 [Kofleriaceae bacterium]|nr:hypothetical protein [Kofleriaceae bacterium]
MTRLWTTLTLCLAATSPAFAQSAGSDDDSNQAGPVETNTNADGLTREGNVQDRTGTDTDNPSDSTAPTNEQVDTMDPNNTQNTSSDETMQGTSEQPGYVVASTRSTTIEQSSERERLGIAIAAGAGAGGFTSDALRGSAGLGGDWDVRLTLGTRSPLAIEASYIGSAQRLSALGLENNAVLVGNGAQGALRLNGTIDFPVQPFIFGGLAWRRYDVTNSAANTSDVAETDDVLEVPAGAGLAGKVSGLIVDVRGEFRYTMNADLVRTGNVDTPVIGVSDNEFGTMHRWGINANVGYEF